MKDFTFIVWCRFGRGDSGETEVEVELTDEEAERLEHYGKQPDVYWDGFANCEPLKDIYKKIYAIAIKQMTEETRDFGDEEYASDPNWEVDDTYACGVEFPSEFEDMLLEEE